MSLYMPEPYPFMAPPAYTNPFEPDLPQNVGSTASKALIASVDFTVEMEIIAQKLHDIAGFVNETYPDSDKITDKHKKNETITSIYTLSKGRIEVILNRTWMGQGLAGGADMIGSAEIKIPKNEDLEGLEGRVKALIFKPSYSTTFGGPFSVVKKIDTVYI